MKRKQLGMGGARLATLALPWVCVLAAGPAMAQTAPPEESTLLNYAFAHELGSGVYEMSGRTVQLYRVPFYVPVRDPGKRAPGVRVTLPVCLGFFDLKPSDVDEPGRSDDDFASATFVPGVALEFPVHPIWTLEPFVEFGIAMEISEDQHSWVYTGGLKSLVELPAGDFGLRIGNRLLYVGAHTPGAEYDDDFAMLETGIELRHALPFPVGGHGLDGGVYAMNYTYLEPTELIVEEKPFEARLQWEFGVTLGTQTSVEIWRFQVPRLGIGYRFGDGISAVRLVFGAAF